MRVFIPGNVPSLKNSKIATSRGVFPSKTVRHYLQFLGVKRYGRDGVDGYKTRPNIFAKDVEPLRNIIKFYGYPVHIGFHFIRNSKRKFDLINAAQIVCDLLVAHGLLPDDDADHLIPYFFELNFKIYSISKTNPGVFLEVECKTWNGRIIK